MTNVIRFGGVPDRAISVRLDRDAQRALATLTAHGLSQSEAIRQALMLAAQAATLEQVQADAERLGRDEGDRALMREILEHMDELAPPG